MLIARAFKTLIILLVIPLLSFLGCKSNGGDEGQKDGAKKRWKLTIVKYEDLKQTEDTEKGLLVGLRDVGLVEGEDFELQTRSAQGDIPTVLSLIDATTTDGTDMLLSLQTPTLHAAVKRASKLPIVFMVVANPFVISTVGESDSAHLPNVTGVYTMTTFDRMIEYIKKCLPNVKRIGTLFSTTELNATYYRSQLLAAANKAGIEVESFGVNSRLDVSQAMQALCSKNKLDAICQIEDNLTSSAFPSIVQVANQFKLPVFSFVDGQARAGSALVVAPDYYEAARSAASIISRIIKGESPATIPFQRVSKFSVIANTANAAAVGLTIPQEILNAANEVIESNVAAK